jgi:hypothetical protein
VAEEKAVLPMILFVINILAYLATVWILTTYFLVQRGSSVRWMNWANFIGSIPLAAVEIYGHVWPPLFTTAAFGIIGLYGLVRDK